MAQITLKTANHVVPMIYAYTTPEIIRHNGWTKIGYTEQDVEKRLEQQTHTADVDYNLEWKGNAIFDDGSGEKFTDHDFHAYLRKLGIEGKKGTEWFHITGPVSRGHFYDFRSNRGLLEQLDAVVPYTLRAEQDDPETFNVKELVPSEGNVFEEYSFFAISIQKMQMAYLSDPAVSTNIPGLVLTLLIPSVNPNYFLEESSLYDHDIKKKIKQLGTKVSVYGTIKGQEERILGGIPSLTTLANRLGRPLKSELKVKAKLGKQLSDEDIDVILETAAKEEFSSFTFTDERDSDKEVMARILELLSMRGIKAERKSIYDDLRAFREQDILDVTVPQGQNREYAVASRTFEISELKMMIDAIQSSKFLSEAKTRDLIKKLEGMCSKHEAKELNRQVIIANRVKSISSSTALFRNVDAIHRAITANAKVSFQYFDFDLKKQKHYMKKGERYVVSPWAMIYTDDNYYLLAYTDGKFKHFRVDHMDNTEAMVTMIADVEIASLEREGAEAFAKLDMSAYTKYTFSMFGGETVPVTMVFQNRMMGAVMDRFGRDVVAMKEDERHFRVTVSVAVSNQFYGWVFGLGKAVRIIGPESVKEGMKKALADIAARYED